MKDYNKQIWNVGEFTAYCHTNDYGDGFVEVAEVDGITASKQKFIGSSYQRFDYQKVLLRSMKKYEKATGRKYNPQDLRRVG